MKYLKSILIILFIVQINSIAQIEWVNPYPSGNQLNGIYFVDSDYGWAVGARGTILKTTDGGKSWFDQSTSSYSELKKVQFLNRNIGWIVGGEPSDGAVLKTTNGGETWIDVNPIAPHSNGFTNLEFITDDFGYIAGFNGVYKTIDGGANWEEKGGPSWATVLHFVNSTDGYVGDSQGSLYKTTDGGNSWRTNLSKYRTWYRDIEFYNEQIGWFIADGLYDEYTVIYKTTNGGESWKLLDSLRGGVQQEIEIINKDTVLICGERGVLRTSDGGENWYSESPNGGDTYYDMAYNDNKLWIVGGDYKQSIIQYSENQGWPWEKVSYNYTLNIIDDIDFYDEQIGWFAGWGGTLYKTTNGGNNWNEVDLFAIDFTTVSVPSNTTVYAAGNSGEFIYSFNSGDSWSINSFGGRFVQPVLKFVSENTGYYISSNWGVLEKTTDRGQTWNQITPSSLVYKLEFFDTLNAIAVGWPMESDHSNLIKTSDGFNTFTEETFPEYITGISFINESVGYISTGWSIHKTSDGGVTWDRINDYQQMQFEPIDIKFIDENFGVAIGIKNNVQKLLLTKDGGLTFTDLKYIPQATKLIKQNNDIWILGNNGMLIKFDMLLVGVGDEDGKEESKEYTFELSQNYPNPFNGMTTINYVLQKSSNVNLSVYNILGQKVDELINEHQFAGSHSIKYDSKKLSSGVYIYTLQTDEFRMSKKFILLK